MSSIEIACPDCGSRNLYASDRCHTWPGGNRADGTVVWMACQGCFTSLEYVCEDCQWSYQHGLNPSNPRAAGNESQRPAWVVGDYNERLVDGWEWPEDGYLGRPIGWVDPDAEDVMAVDR